MALHDHMKSARVSLETLMAAFAKERRALEKEKEQWANMEPKLDTSNLQDPITLNVGGTHFALTLKDLTRKKGSYFSSMFSGRWAAKVDKNGAFFINRSPVAFHYVADYLRGEKIPVDLLSPLEKKRLKADAEFYRLDALARKLAEPGEVTEPGNSIVGELKFMSGITRHIILSQKHRNVMKSFTGTSAGDSTVVGPEMAWPSSGFSEVRVKYQYECFKRTMIGIAPSQSLIAAAKAGTIIATHTTCTCGWFLCTSEGTLYSEDGQADEAYTRREVPNGATVGIRLHNDGKVSFAVDGIDYGTAFTIPAGLQCRVAVVPFNEGTSVELLEDPDSDDQNNSESE